MKLKGTKCNHRNIKTVWVLGVNGRRRPGRIVCIDCGKVIIEAQDNN